MRPKLVRGFKDSGEKIVDVNCGEAYTIAEIFSGKIYAWGQGKVKQPLLINNVKASLDSDLNKSSDT